MYNFNSEINQMGTGLILYPLHTFPRTNYTTRLFTLMAISAWLMCIHCQLNVLYICTVENE